MTSAAEHGHTGARHNSFCTPPELTVDLSNVQLFSGQLFYCFTRYGLIAGVQVPTLIARGAPERPHNAFPLLGLD